MDKLDLKIIMPFYNEQENAPIVIHDWITEIRKLNITFRLIAYNDGSKDKTSEILEQLIMTYQELIPITKRNSGHGPTILKGYTGGLNTDWVFQTDSDNEMGPEHLHKLWNEREKYDFLIGHRDNRTGPITRKIISLISRMTVRLFYGSGVYDVNSPYRLMRYSFFKKHFKSIPRNTFAPNIIISGIACLYNARIKSFLIPHQQRQLGEVSIKKWKLLKASIKSFFQTISYRFTLEENDEIEQ